MSRQPVLVGELNPYGSNPAHALFCWPPNSAGERLQRRVFAMWRAEYLALKRHNLCTGKWSDRAAREAASALQLLYPPQDHGFVLLGSKVAAAFHVPFVPFSVQRGTDPGDDRNHVVLPHPSGRCRLWNRAGAYEEARALVAAQFPDVPLGALDGSS